MPVAKKVRLGNKQWLQWFSVLLVIAVVAVIGVKLLTGSHAATNPFKVVWGGYDNRGGPYSGKGGFITVEEAAFGRKLAVRLYSQQPDVNLDGKTTWGDGSEEKNQFLGGRIVAYSVSNGIHDADVNSGMYDAKFKALFDRLLSLPYGKNGAAPEMWFIYQHEMNAGGETNTGFKNAWIHVHNIYEQERSAMHVSSSPVKFTFTPTHALYNFGTPSDWWPGDQYVDIIGSDLYNDTTKNPWKGFPDMFNGNGDASTISKFAGAHGKKPIAFLEIGTRENSDRAKQWWIDLANFVNNNNADSTKAPIIAIMPFTGGSNWGISQALFPLQHQGVAQALQINNASASTYGYGGTPGPDTIPSVTLTAPNNGVSINPGSIPLTATASDDKPGVKVAFSYKLHSATTWTAISTITASPFNTTWAAGSLAANSYDIRAVATDSIGQNSAPSISTINLTTGPPSNPQPDLVVTGITALPTAPTSSQKVTFSAIVKNQGNAAVAAGTKFGLAFDIDGTEVSWTAGFSDGIAAGATASLTANGGPGGVSTWTAAAGNHTLKATVDDTNKIVESNDNNNVMQVALNVPQPPSPQAPQPPTTLVSGSQTTSSIALSWTASKPGTNGAPASQLVYFIKRDGKLLGPTAAGVTNFNDTGLPPGSTHSYVVYATDPQGRSSDDSTALTVKTKSLNCSAPAAPGGFKAVAQASATDVALTWSAVSATAPCTIDHYIVQQGTKAIASPTGTSFTVSALTPNTSYTFNVLAVTNDGKPGTAATVTVKTPAKTDGTPPTAPTNLVALPVSSSQVNLTWTAASDPESSIKTYHIKRNGQEIATTSSTSFGDSGLDPNTAYTYVVVAENGASPSKTTASAAATVTTLSDNSGDTGGGSGDGTGDGSDSSGDYFPVLDDTSSVGTGDDSGLASDQHSYDPSTDSVSDDPSADQTTPDGSSTPAVNSTLGQATTNAKKAATSTPVRLVAGISGAGLLIGAPLAVGLVLRRLPTRLALAGDPWDETVTGPAPTPTASQPTQSSQPVVPQQPGSRQAAPGQVVEPTQTNHNEEPR